MRSFLRRAFRKEILMKKLLRGLLVMGLILVLLLCVGCGPSADNPAPEVSTVPVEGPTVQTVPKAEPETSPEPADFFDLVFDTSEDEGKLTVRYLYMTKDDGDCYAGDSAVYTAPTGEIMLVDCGNASNPKEVMAQLDAMGIKRIDYMVFSHPHADHVGGFLPILTKYEIGQIYVNGHNYGTTTYQDVLASIKIKKVPCDVLLAGDSFMFGELVKVDIFNPFPGDTDDVDLSSMMDTNNCSLAMLLTYGESTFWTSGDLYTPAEERLVEVYGNIQADVVKMNHHGKDTSNCVHYLDMLQSKIAVAMLNDVSPKGIHDRYVYRRVQVFYTYADGAVRVATTGDGTYDVQTQLLRTVPYMADPAPDGHYVVE